MAGSEIGLGEGHPATIDRQNHPEVKTEFREVSPGQFGYVAVRDTIAVPQRTEQLSEIANGPGDATEKGFVAPKLPESHDFNPDN